MTDIWVCDSQDEWSNENGGVEHLVDFIRLGLLLSSRKQQDLSSLACKQKTKTPTELEETACSNENSEPILGIIHVEEVLLDNNISSPHFLGAESVVAKHATNHVGETDNHKADKDISDVILWILTVPIDR